MINIPLLTHDCRDFLPGTCTAHVTIDRVSKPRQSLRCQMENLARTNETQRFGRDWTPGWATTGFHVLFTSKLIEQELYKCPLLILSSLCYCVRERCEREKERERKIFCCVCARLHARVGRDEERIEWAAVDDGLMTLTLMPHDQLSLETKALWWQPSRQSMSTVRLTNMWTRLSLERRHRKLLCNVK